MRLLGALLVVVFLALTAVDIYHTYYHGPFWPVITLQVVLFTVALRAVVWPRRAGR